MDLFARPATPENFAPYGHVLRADCTDERWPINGGATMRHHAIAPIEAEGAPAIISLFEALQIPEPGYEIVLIEHHPLGSQAFIPLAGQQLIVVVGAPGAADPSKLECFSLDGAGVSFAAGTWHATLIAPDGGSFLIVDRDDPASNCVVHDLAENIHIHW